MLPWPTTPWQQCVVSQLQLVVMPSSPTGLTCVGSLPLMQLALLALLLGAQQEKTWERTRKPMQPPWEL